jgi:hypothetical protein
MAPEQVEGTHGVDHRADIYALGVTFYEMLTGELPLGRFAPPSQKFHLDVRLDEVVLRALEKDPDRRYQHASDVKTDVDAIRTSAPPPTVDPLEQLVVDRWPEGKVAAVLAYYREQKSFEPDIAEAKRAVEEIARRRQLPGWDRPVTGLVWRGRIMLFVVFAGIVSCALWLRLSPVLSIPLTLAFLVVPQAYRAWKNWDTPQGQRAAGYAAFWAFLALGGPVLSFLAEPEPVLQRLYELTGTEPGAHDALFLRGLLVVLILGSLIGLIQWLFTHRKRGTPQLQPASAKPTLASVPSPEEIRQQVRRASTGLLVAGLLLLVGWVPFAFLAMILWGKNANWVELWTVLQGFWAIVGAVVVRGALDMRQMRRHGFALVAAAMALIPVSFQGVLALPLGIWALVVLNRKAVRDEFKRLERLDQHDAADRSPASARRQIQSAAVGLLISGFIIMMSWLPATAIVLGSLDLDGQPPNPVLAPHHPRSRVSPALEPLMAFYTLWSLFAGAFIVREALQMRQLRGHSLVTAGAILAMLPFSPGVIFGLPLGLWVWRILRRPEVRAEFERVERLDQHNAADRSPASARRQVQSATEIIGHEAAPPELASEFQPIEQLLCSRSKQAALARRLLLAMYLLLVVLSTVAGTVMFSRSMELRPAVAMGALFGISLGSGLLLFGAMIFYSLWVLFELSLLWGWSTAPVKLKLLRTCLLLISVCCFWCFCGAGGRWSRTEFTFYFGQPFVWLDCNLWPDGTISLQLFSWAWALLAAGVLCRQAAWYTANGQSALRRTSAENTMT